MHFCVSWVSTLSFLPRDSQRAFWLLLWSECVAGLWEAESLIAVRNTTLVIASLWFFTSAACTESPPPLSWSSPSEQIPFSLPITHTVMQRGYTEGTQGGVGILGLFTCYSVWKWLRACSWISVIWGIPQNCSLWEPRGRSSIFGHGGVRQRGAIVVFLGPRDLTSVSKGRFWSPGRCCLGLHTCWKSAVHSCSYVPFGRTKRLCWRPFSISFSFVFV